MAAINFEGVWKRYGDGFEAVKDLNLEIRDGEFMILVGPSGCGKSTALRMVAGLEEITAGDLIIGGERVNELAPRDRDIAMVFQNYALYPHMTVRENMGFALKLAKVPKAEVAAKVESVAEILELQAHLDRKPANLSGGQRQRVAMGRAVVRDPKAFLMDEPLSNLDAKLRVQMRTEVARIQNRLGTTMLYVTHDQTEAMTLGDRVAVMRAGVVQQVDTPKTLYQSPANLFVAGFIGSPAMNFVRARLEEDRVRLPFGDAPIPAGLRDAPREVIVGFRPEHFEDAHGLRFTVTPDVVESVGSEQYAYFDAGAAGAVKSEQLDEIAADAGAETFDTTVIARLDAASPAAAGQPLELALDVSKLMLFNPADGLAL
jgi:multiple sugar transport system ATP-binding protein